MKNEASICLSWLNTVAPLVSFALQLSFSLPLSSYVCIRFCFFCFSAAFQISTAHENSRAGAILRKHKGDMSIFLFEKWFKIGVEIFSFFQNFSKKFYFLEKFFFGKKKIRFFSWKRKLWKK
jgi:hypothetical protein